MRFFKSNVTDAANYLFKTGMSLVLAGSFADANQPQEHASTSALIIGAAVIGGTLVALVGAASCAVVYLCCCSNRCPPEGELGEVVVEDHYFRTQESDEGRNPGSPVSRTGLLSPSP